ncbi:MAG: thermonuclease family protein [Sphingomonas bacterium]|nr:thermonuclease family protein [Sphingomonas bacterium]
MQRGLEDVAGGGAEAAPNSAPVRASFGLCHSGGGTNCVVDGDTIWIGGHNVRLADIDAPETHAPRCAGEQALGDRATRRLHALVNSGAVTLTSIDRDHDRYGRKLRIVAVGGASVGDTLVGEGLARWYAGGRRSWCG